MADCPSITLTDLVREVRLLRPKADIGLIERAYAFADAAHRGQVRRSGGPYIIHPLHTAMNLVRMHATDDMIVAGLLHDVAEDTSVTLKEIETAFGADVAGMVNGICKVGKVKYRGVERYMENLRRMFMAMANDARVIVIKFADRLHNLQTLDCMPQKKAYRIALESLEIYAPIANRLGMGEIKGLLEDEAFRWVYPKEYAWTKELAETSVQVHQPHIEHVIERTRGILATNGIGCLDIHGRRKHLYSLYRKLLKCGRDISKIHDLTAIRCILPTTGDCYAALGMIHAEWMPLKGKIKDYISQPKPNGYQSLHTTVFYDRGAIVEFQFRTQQMHDAAEFGIAAHWAYDERKPSDPSKKPPLVPQDTEWMNQIAEAQTAITDKKEFLTSLEDLKINVFRDRIFVYTPKGDVIDLPEDATPVDFAYAIHSQIGNTCAAAMVNDSIFPLDQPLKSGDIVEIITDKGRKGPNPDWIASVKTRDAKNRIRQSSRAGLASWIKDVIPGIRKKNQT